MDFREQIRELGGRVGQLKEHISTEEATKNAFIMPFLQILGFNVFNPLEVKPEFVADVGLRKAKKSTMRFSKTASLSCWSNASIGKRLST